MRAFLTVLVLAASAAPASASFPGHNGRFAFVALDKHNNEAIFTQLPNRKGLKLVRHGGISPTWSADGRRILFADGQGVGVVKADGSGYRHFDAPTGVGVDDPTWAPDGKRVAFTGYTVDNASNEISDTAVYVGKLGAFQRVATGFDPAWAPNGRRIAYTSIGGACRGIFTMKPNGSARHRVTGRTKEQCRVFGSGGSEADWSPDSKRIAYVRPVRKAGNASERNDEVFVIGATGHGDARVTHTGGADEADPVFSPDGRLLAYGSYGSPQGLFYGTDHFRGDVLQVSWQPR
jgi:Tol biopolymer transport system component